MPVSARLCAAACALAAALAAPAVGDIPRIDIDFDALADDGRAQVVRLAAFAGVAVTIAALTFPTPELRRF